MVVRQRNYVTSDEHIKLVEITNSFWEKFGILAAEHVAQMPEELEDLTISHFQDHCSIYGSLCSYLLPKVRATLQDEKEGS